MAENLIKRPPVVVIMGHIDHGKSTLLDYIRKSNIVAKEAGGITQHLGAYEVEHTTKEGAKSKITFLDTPGHEAFASIRETGANCADIAILIVSAEDGVMPQTKEVLEIINRNKVPYIVAINKIDSPKANINKTIQSLIENEVYIEGYGGNIPCAQISAKGGQGVSELLDLIILHAEVEEYKGDKNKSATGFIVESHKDKFKGIAATLVIKDGVLRQGDCVVSGKVLAPVRIIEDQFKQNIKEASFSTPICIVGWSDLPPVGSEFKTCANKKEAETSCETCAIEDRKDCVEIIGKVTNETIFLPILIKADTFGSIEAIRHELQKLEVENVAVKILSTSIGNLTEADMKLASSTPHSVVVAFNVGIDRQADVFRERAQILTEYFSIIYELSAWIEDAMKERKPKIETEEITGEAKIIKEFNRTGKNIQVLGAKIRNGKIKIGIKVRILRRNEKIGEGIIKELQAQRSKTSEVSEESEFGTAIESKTDIEPGDIIQGFEITKQ